MKMKLKLLRKTFVFNRLQHFHKQQRQVLYNMTLKNRPSYVYDSIISTIYLMPSLGFLMNFSQDFFFFFFAAEELYLTKEMIK